MLHCPVCTEEQGGKWLWPQLWEALELAAIPSCSWRSSVMVWGWLVQKGSLLSRARPAEEFCCAGGTGLWSFKHVLCC